MIEGRRLQVHRRGAGAAPSVLRAVNRAACSGGGGVGIGALPASEPSAGARGYYQASIPSRQYRQYIAGGSPSLLRPTDVSAACYWHIVGRRARGPMKDSD